MNDSDRPAAGSAPCPEGYGPSPRVRDVVCAFAKRTEEIIASLPREEIAPAVAEAMKPMLAEPDLLDESHCLCQPETYRRHVLYADPARKFTVLALVWRPGHKTPVHGHRAWGAVGVYEGRPNVAIYRCEEGADGERCAEVTGDAECAPGDVTYVQPGYDDVHCIYNATEERVITIHVYGRDLVEEPESINLVVSA